MLIPPEPVSQDALSMMSNKLNSILGNKTLADLTAAPPAGMTELNGLEKAVMQRVMQLMQQCEENRTSTLYSDGWKHAARARVFRARKSQVVRVLQQRNRWKPSWLA